MNTLAKTLVTVAVLFVMALGALAAFAVGYSVGYDAGWCDVAGGAKAPFSEMGTTVGEFADRCL